MRSTLIALLRLIDFLEGIPYDVRYAVDVAWLHLAYPFKVALIKWQTRQAIRQIDRKYSRERK